MLRKIILKNFRYNLKNYLLFFLSNTLAVSLFFVFSGLKNNLGKNVTDEAANYILNVDFLMAVIMLSIVSALLTVYAVRYYVRLRIKDYSMLTLLGLRKKKLQQIVVAEYGLGWLLSVLVGLLFGNLIYFSFQELLYHISADMIQKSVVGAKPYFYTVFMGLILVLLVVMITLTMMEGKDLDSFAAGKETREFKLESWKWVFLPVIGIGLFIAGDYASYKSGKGMIVAQIFWIVSAVLIFYVGISLALEFLKTRKKFYMKNLLRLNQLYHHFTSNFLIIFMLFLIHFFVAGYVAYGVGSCLPIYADPTMYPYDFVWSAKVEDEKFMNDLVDKYDGKVKMIPMFKVVTRSGLDHFGISQSTYQNLTGNRCELGEDEILAYREDNTKKEKKTQKKEIEIHYEYVHMGKFRGEYMKPDAYQDFGYEKLTTKKIICGNYLGRVLDGYRDSWVVMSDSRFERCWEELKKDPEEFSALALFQIPEKNHKKAWEELETYYAKHGVEELGGMQNALYDMKEITDGFAKRNLFQLSSKLLLMGALLFSSIFILKMKAMTEEDSMSRRYAFLHSMGMCGKQRRKNAKFEISCVAAIPLVAGIIYGINYILINWKMTTDSGEEVAQEYMMIRGAVILLYMVIQIIGIRIVAVTTSHKIIRE